VHYTISCVVCTLYLCYTISHAVCTLYLHYTISSVMYIVSALDNITCCVYTIPVWHITIYCCVHCICIALHTLSCNISVYDARTWNLHVYIIGINIASWCSTRKYNSGYIICNNKFNTCYNYRGEKIYCWYWAAFCLPHDKVTEQKMACRGVLHGP